MTVNTLTSDFSLPDDLRDVYFLLLKKSPLTIGELVFLTKKPEDKIKNNLKTLISSGFVREIEDSIPLFIAIFPSLFLKSNLDSFLKDLNEFDLKFREKNKVDLSSLLSNLESLKSDYRKKSTDLVKSYDSIHSVAKQELESQSQNLIKNSLQIQTETLKEVSNDLSEQRLLSTTNLNNFSVNMNEFFEKFNSKFNDLIENLQNLTSQNKKQVRKAVADTIKSLDEGAKLLGKNVNDQLKTFEGRLIDSINATISSTVELSSTFKDQLTEDYSTWRIENTEFVNTFESTNENFITESINSNISLMNSSIGKVLEKLQGNIELFSKLLSDLSKKTIKSYEEKNSQFLKDVTEHTTTFTDNFKLIRDDFDDSMGGYNTLLAEYEKSMNMEIKTYLTTSFQNFEENLKILNQILSEYINNARLAFDKEYSLILTQDSDVLDRIGEILSSLKVNYENELTSLQNNIEGLENNLKDLSVAIKRRFDKFSSEASSKLLSIGNKVIDELLNIQGSNIDLIDQYKAVKLEFGTVLNTFFGNNAKLLSKSQEEFVSFSKNMLDKKSEQLQLMEKEIKDYSIFVGERYSILDNQLKVKNNEFINEFKAALSKIREDTQVIIQTEQVEYLNSLTEVNSNSDVLLNQQKDNIVSALDGLSNSLTKSLQDALDTITSTFTKLKTSLISDINQQKSSFTDTFNTINANVEEISSNYMTNYKGILENSINSLKSVEVSYWSKFEDTFGKNKEKILEIYKTNSDTLQGKTNSIIKSLTSLLDDLVDSFSDVNGNVSESLTTFSKEIKEKIEEVQNQSEGQFQVFEDLSSSLGQISQKSKLEIEQELLDVETELKTITDKNFDSYSQLMSSSTGQISKSLANLSETGVEHINDFEKETQTNIQLLKQENETNRENHSSSLQNLSKEAISELANRNIKQLATFKESRMQLEEKSQLLTETLMKKLLENQTTFYDTIASKFDTLQETIPERMKAYFSDFKVVSKELIETINQNIVKELSDNINNSASNFKNSQSESMKSLQQSLNGIKSEFSENLTRLKDEFLETSKLRLEEIEIQVNKEMESFQSKLVKKENDDVKKLRELIQSINSVGIFNELVNDNLITKIDPMKDSFDNNLTKFQTDFEKQLQNTGINELNEIQQKTMNEFNNLLVNAYNTSIGKLNIIQKSFTEQMNSFQLSIKSFLDKTIEASKANEINLLKENDDKILNLQESQSKIISDLIEKVLSSFQEQNSKLNKLITDYNQFFNAIHSVLVKQDKESDTMFKSRLINVPEDVFKYLEKTILKTDKRIDLIIPRPELLDIKPIIDLHTRVRIKIVINSDPKSDKNDKRKNWVYELYKKKANVQLYDSNAVSNLIICIRDNSEVLVVPENSNNEFNPGFVIENNLYADFFAKAIVNNIILSATPITRENQK